MKVDVLTIEDITIPKWRWWSNWIDVAVFNFGGFGYLLQMKISRTNVKRFTTRRFSGVINTAHASTSDVGSLTAMEGTP